MSKIEHWIDTLEDNELRKLSKEFTTGLIKPHKKTKENIITHIEKAQTTGVEAEKKSIRMPFVVRYAPAAAILCAIGLSLFFLIPMMRPVQGIVLLSSGTPGLVEANETSPLSPGMAVKKGSSIVTEKDSLCGIQFMDYAIIKMNEKTRLSIREIQKDTFSLDLLEGELLIKTEGLPQGRLCEVTTPAETIRFGSTLLIRYIDHATCVALHKGTAQIIIKGTAAPEDIITLSPGETIVREEGGNPVKEGIQDHVESRLETFTVYEMLRQKQENATLSIVTQPDDVVLMINKKEFERFHNNLSLTLKPGSYAIDIRIREPFTAY
jgi:hypothetical protein